MQKDLGWTAGSILEKHMDLSDKNRAWIELLLHCHGLRVHFRKTRGLFSKTARPNRYPRISAVRLRSKGFG